MSRITRCAPFLALFALVSTADVARSDDPKRSAIPDGVYGRTGGTYGGIGGVSGIAEIDEVGSCAQDAHIDARAYARRAYTVRALPLTHGGTVYLAETHDPCMHGQNGSFTVITKTRGDYHYVYLGNAEDTNRFSADGSGVRIHARARGPNVAVRETLSFEGDDYRVTRDDFVWTPTGEVKPERIPLQFAPGASSATVSGKLYEDFDDRYALVAQAGQTMTVDVRATSGTLSRVSVDEDGDPLDGPDRTSYHYRGRIPKSGATTITVQGGVPKTTTYTMIVAIH